MSRQPDVYVQDIAEAITRIEQYRARAPNTAIGEDDMQTDAIIRNLEIIGEAVKQLPDDVTQECPGIEWRKIAGFRDVLIHAYFEVNTDILQDVVDNKLPELKQCINNIQEAHDR